MASSTHATTTRPAQQGAQPGTPTGLDRSPLPNDMARPLPPALAQDMGQRFGADFSGVKLHQGTAAHQHADALDARAYTVGEHVVLGRKTAALSSQEGKRTLAHELAHVVQQRRGGPPPVLSADAPHEAAADRAANAAVSGSGPVSVGGGTGVGVARDKDEDKKKKPPKPQWARGMTPDQQRDAQRKKDVLEEFTERAHDPKAELSEERTTRRSGKSEQARHADRLQDIDEHHGYPKFIGGNRIQKYIKLSKDLHYLYHEELYHLLEKEFKAAGKLPNEAGRLSRKHYGRMVRSMTPAQKKALLEKITDHARKFDSDHRSQYPDKRQKLEVAVRRGIREADDQKAEKNSPKQKAQGKPAASAGSASAAKPAARASGSAVPAKPAQGVATAPKRQASASAGTPQKPAANAAPALTTKRVSPTPARPQQTARVDAQVPQAKVGPARPVPPPPAARTPSNAGPSTGSPPSRPPGTTRAETRVADNRVPGGPPQSAGAAKMQAALGVAQLAGAGATLLGNYIQGKAAQEAYQQMLPTIQERQAATDKGLWVHFTYTHQEPSSESVFNQVPMFTGIHLQEGTRDERRPPALWGAGGSLNPVRSEWLPPGQHSLKTDLSNLWRRQKAAQTWGEREVKRNFIGRWLMERKGSSIDITPVYDARAHLSSARIALDEGRDADAEASMAAARAHLDTFLQTVKDYTGKTEF